MVIENSLTTQELGSLFNFRSVTDLVPIIVFIANPQGKTEYFNQRWYEFTKSNFAQSKDKGWVNYIHPEDAKAVSTLWKEALEKGNVYEMEFRIKNGETGEYNWFLGRAVPLRDEKKKIIKWFGTCTNIHYQKIATDIQTFLSESSKTLASSLNYKETLETVANLAVPKIADWCSIELLENGNLVQAVVAHKDPKKAKWARDLRKKMPPDMNAPQGLAKVLKTGKSEFYPFITKEMLYKAVKTKAQLKLVLDLGFTSAMIIPITINGKTIGAIQFVTTESKKRFTEIDLKMGEELASRAALAIQNSQLYELAQNKEKQLKSLYDSNIIGVFYANGTGQIYDSNNYFLNLIGYTEEDLKKGRIHLDKLTPPEFKIQYEKTRQEILKTGSVFPWEKEYIKKDGSQVPVIVGKVLIQKEPQEILAFVLDITERKRLEQRKDEFIGIASHELKTPLTSIKGYVQILERIIKQLDDAKLNVYLQKTNSYVDRLNSLISDLLDVSKIQAGKLQLNLTKFNFNDLIDEIIENIRHTNTSHEIIKEGSTNKKILGDEHRLEQVLSNLIINAIKYSPKADKVIIKSLINSKELKVSITDFGIGVPKKDQEKLFQRFYRVEKTSKKFSGLGIGLYISSEIIERHGGKIWVESKEGKGSTFYFTIPLSLKES